ncbi:uncharacterized protein BP01DRAFT_103246 [Aspergillus saccharolyticus JOP 1030-1]|uniref:Uncharacterized protein n=1 Tax=Aspergillus saccharolyticus JOP 1030-1 TaxID=1450539 RepID=A0A318ZFG6_9EURO|nr:hypothetical protein BP01DRAFT_103246 [Aspergillus saccharolyticus JOP 1030-1]PYH43383.1 hypothetical protein BP01DRAFT_103246 [Aspergillus saccharolyticus JOP 1030-1]
MYGSNSQPSSRDATHTGPIQPEWRLAPKTSTATPQHPPQPAWQATPPLPVRPSPNPGGIRPTASPSPVNNGGATASPTLNPAGLDTTSWGVKYNRQQSQASSPPPLPPRPPSTTHTQSIQASSPAVGSLDATRPLSGTPVQAAQHVPNPNSQWPTSVPSFAPQQQDHSTATQRPPPPPIPYGFQDFVSHPGSQAQSYLQFPPYSSAVPIQHHDFLVQQPTTTIPIDTSLVGSAAPAMGNVPATSAQQAHFSQSSRQSESQSPWVYETAASLAPELRPVAAPPVPPKTNPAPTAVSASALGPGTPPDVGKLSPIPGRSDDVVASPALLKHELVHAVNSVHSSDLSETTVLAFHGSRSSSGLPPSDSHTGYSSMQPEIQDSPVSIDTVQDGHESPLPTRINVRMNSSESIPSSVSTSETAESIDGVIEAWTRPLTTDLHKPGLLDDVEPEHAAQEEGEPNLRLTGTKVGEREVSKRTTLPALDRPDPFDDLDTWSRSSVERYVAMLRKEAVADTDSDRFEIFTSFMAKETKLREVLYNIEPASKGTEQKTSVTPLSATPTSYASRSDTDHAFPPVESGLIPVETEEPTITAENFGDGSYSPGGRPILRVHTPGLVGLGSSSAQAVAGPYGGQTPSSRPASVPPTMMNFAAHKQDLPPLASNPPQPIYTPFRYTEGPQRGSDALVFDRPAYQAYSALRQASAESGRVMSNGLVLSSEELPLPAETLDHARQDETFIGLIREKSLAYRKTASQKLPTLPPLPASLRQGRLPDPLDEMRSIVSSSIGKESMRAVSTTTGKTSEEMTDDFSYIQKAIKTWVASNESRRVRLEKERTRRQEESERHIDVLFNGKEIGYADINVLEEEFRQKEARCQLEEERQELNDFIARVFDPLDKRLREEVLALQTDYEAALARLDNDGSTSQDKVKDHSHLSKTMRDVNEIYQSLEARYQKRLEIALDRERRRKKAERRPLVFIGDSTALKRLDQEFDQMETRNKLEAARERDARANRLMDSFDDVIMHGLGENQRILDDITAKMSRIDAASLRFSSLSEAEIVNLLESVNRIVEYLGEDSKSILENFGIADAVLNEADYSVSVAEARCSEAEDDVFRQLEAEKKKEDKKIRDDLRFKLESVKEGPFKVTASIKDLLRSLGHETAPEQRPTMSREPVKQPNNAESSSPSSTPKPASGKIEEDSEHQERLRKALENAKKRNAARKTT